jgi:peptidoglycan/xylan/chitin deacetylase (PgdA/CDA1 family)
LQSKSFSKTLQKTKWHSVSERLAYVRKLSPFLKQLNNFERLNIYEQIMEGFKDVEKPEGFMMNWDDIRTVYENGCEIGSHSVSHPLLAKKSNIEQIEKELVESGKIIENKIGRFPLSFAYPFGSYNEIIKKIVLKSGYRFALTVEPHTYLRPNHNVFEIPRVELYSESLIKAKLRINGVICKINEIIR